MKDIKDITEQMKELEISWNKPEKQSDIFQDMQNTKILSLREIIDEINELIEKRRKLSLEVFKDADAVKMDIKNFMSEIGSLMSPNNPNIPALLELKKKQAELEEIKMQEKINCWKDIARLKEELRTYIKEAKDKERRLDALNQMMEEK